MITGSTLQEEIEATGRRLILQGQNILGLKPPGTQTIVNHACEL